MVPLPVDVRRFPLIVPGPEATLNVPPVGVPINVLVSPEHMGALLLVMTGFGPIFDVMFWEVIPVHPFWVTLY